MKTALYNQKNVGVQVSSDLAKHHFQNRQLGLFQEFLFNSNDEREKLSNSIELWDSIPRYSISKQAMTKRRDERGNLDLLKLEFEHRGKRYSIQIQAAIIEEKIRGGKIRTRAYYPSANEELVEEALRKLAIDSGKGYFDNAEPTARSGVVFSLYQLRKELKRRGHTRSFDEIKDSLNILSGSTIQIVSDVVQDKTLYSRSSYLPLMAGVTRKSLEHDPSDRWLVQFHPLVAAGINNLSYRQFNYDRLMRITTPLARWLNKLLISKYTFASKLNLFEIRYSTIRRDSVMLSNYSRERAAQEACNLSMKELITHGVLSAAEPRLEIGKRGKVIDIIYTLVPSMAFMAEVKAANKRLKMLSTDT